ncbi:RNA-directed DNA polymerase [Chloroflexota bacterium]
MLDLFSLLSRGYFFRELPPPFSSELFANVMTAQNQPIPSSFTNSRRLSKHCLHNVARVGLHRRKMRLPNPVGFYNLASDLVRNWSSIDAHNKRSPFSKSIPSVHPIGRAVIPEYSFVDLLGFRAFVRANSRYILRADISNFYPTIYTHSIPWAIHTKPIAKTNRKYSLYGNSVDRWARNCQDGQTIGIPIGPDTSLIIAEIILNAADTVLASYLSGSLSGIRGFRHIDDYEFGCSSFAQAEELLAKLQQAINEFELELNLRKTSIIELPIPLESPWVSELRDFPLPSYCKAPETRSNHVFRSSNKVI